MPRSLCKLPLTALVLGGIALAAAAARAQSDDALLASMRKSGEAKVAIAAAPPWAFMSPGGEPQGYVVDLAAAALKSMGVAKISATVTTWDAMIPGLQAKRFDFVPAGLLITEARCKVVAFSAPVTAQQDALYVLPGSHRRGRIDPYYDENTSYKFWAVPRAQMISVLRESPPPVPIVGPAGTAVLFHCNLMHASGHNLTAEDRWHIYISFNTCANAPKITEASRPDWVVSRNTRPLRIEADVLRAA